MKTSVFGVFAIALAAGVTNGAVVTWNFGTSAGDANPSSGSPLSGLTISAVTQGNNNGTTSLLTTISASTTPTFSGQFNAGAAARVGALSTGANGSAYFEFTLTPDVGFTFTFSDIDFASRRTGTGPQAFTLRSSADSYASDLTSGTMTALSTWTAFAPAAFSSTSNAGSAITYRLFGYGGSGTPTAGTANWRIDDLAITVEVIPSPVPEPSTYAGFAGALLLGFGVWRRSRRS